MKLHAIITHYNVKTIVVRMVPYISLLIRKLTHKTSISSLRVTEMKWSKKDIFGIYVICIRNIEKDFSFFVNLIHYFIKNYSYIFFIFIGLHVHDTNSSTLYLYLYQSHTILLRKWRKGRTLDAKPYQAYWNHP